MIDVLVIQLIILIPLRHILQIIVNIKHQIVPYTAVLGLKVVVDVQMEKIHIITHFVLIELHLYSNKTVIYLAYIGKNLVKVGFSDKRLCKREEKHTSCESQFQQFRIIKAFEVSGQPIEKLLKDLLHVYNVKFHFQCEIYKPPGSLENFIEIVANMLNEHDLKFQLDNLRARCKELEIENLNLRLRLNGECTEGC